MEVISFFNYRKKAHVSKVVKGDKEAILALIDKNKINIYRVARGILRDEEDIKGAMQNIVIKALEKISTFIKYKNKFYYS